MARILICHMPQDAAAARELGAALMGRGHAVSFDGEPDSPRHDRFSRLRYFDAVIIVWTQESAASPGLTQIAGHALHANLLVPVRAEGLDLTRLPLAFRKLVAFQVRDADAVTRYIARLTSAQSSLKEMRTREAAAAPNGAPRAAASPPPARAAHEPPARAAHAPPPLPVFAPVKSRLVSAAERLPEVDAPDDMPDAAAAPSDEVPHSAAFAALCAQTEAPHRVRAAVSPPPLAPAPPAACAIDLPGVPADDGLVRAVAGRLSLRVPRRMRLGQPEPIAVRFGPVLPGRPFEDEPSLTAGTQLRTMSVSLYAKGGAFDITRASDTTQEVADDPFAASHDAEFARWEWLVIPRRGGAQRLSVRVSATLEDARGLPVSTALPDREIEITVTGAETAYDPLPAQGAGPWPGLRGLFGGLRRRS